MSEKKDILTKYVAYVEISPKAKSILTENKIQLLSFTEMITKLLLLNDVLVSLNRKGFMREPTMWMLRALRDKRFLTWQPIKEKND